MNPTFKFRLFNKFANSFVYNDITGDNCESNWHLNIFTGKLHNCLHHIESGRVTITTEHSNKIYSLFTGAADKNGIDIYVGDIVSYCGIEFEVKFESIVEGCKLVSKAGSILDITSMDMLNQSEVVGNIYIK